MGRINYPKELVKPDGRRLIAGGPRDMQRRVLSDGAAPSSVLDTTELLGKIEELNQALKHKPAIPDGYLSPEQVDAEIRKAVEDAVKETTLAMKKVSQQTKNQSDEVVLQKYKQQIVDMQKTNDDLIKLHSEITKNNDELKNKVIVLDEAHQKHSDEVKALEIKIAVLEQSLKDKDETITVLKSYSGAGEGVVVEDPNRPKIDSVFIDPLEKGAGTGLKSFIQTSDVTREEKDEMQSKVSKLKSLLGKLPTRRQED